MQNAPKSSRIMCANLQRHWEFFWLAFAGICVCYTLRVNMSVAASSMVDDLDWTEIQKGTVLSAFYWGYALGQIPASYLMMNGTLSPKWTFGLAVFIPSLLTMLVPLFARSSYKMALAIRIAIGFVESATFPCCYQFYQAWIPPQSKTFMIALLLSGTYVGEILGFSLSGVLIDTTIKIGDTDIGGWPCVFYFFGLMGVVWFPFWAVYAYESPEVHPGISQEEVEFIRGGDLRKEMPINTDGRLRIRSVEIPDPRNLPADVESMLQRGFNRSVDRKAVYTFGSDSHHSSDERLRSIDLDTEPSRHLTTNLLSEQLSPLTITPTARDPSMYGLDGDTTRKTTNKGPMRILQRDGSYGEHSDSDSEYVSLANVNEPAKTIKSNKSGVGPGADDEIIEFSRIPWKHILRHSGFWNLMITAWIVGFLQFMLLSELPSYLQDQLGFSVSNAGVLSTIPFAFMFIVGSGMGQFLFNRQKYHGWSTVSVRLFAQTVGMIGPAIFMLLCAYGQDQMGQWGTYVCIVIAVALIGSTQAGYACSYLEFAPKFSPFLNTFGNALGAVAGIAGPEIISYLLTADKSTGWQFMFLGCSIMCIGSVVFWYFYAVTVPVELCNTMLPKEEVSSTSDGNGNTYQSLSPVAKI